MNTRSCTKVIFMLILLAWLMHPELGYCAPSFILGFNNGTVTLRLLYFGSLVYSHSRLWEICTLENETNFNRFKQTLFNIAQLKTRQMPSVVSPASHKFPTSSLLEMDSSLTLALWPWETLSNCYVKLPMSNIKYKR